MKTLKFDWKILFTGKMFLQWQILNISLKIFGMKLLTLFCKLDHFLKWKIVLIIKNWSNLQRRRSTCDHKKFCRILVFLAQILEILYIYYGHICKLDKYVILNDTFYFHSLNGLTYWMVWVDLFQKI
jgi:hypothetical protein